MLLSHDSPNSCGTAIFMSNSFNCTLLSTVFDPTGRYTISKLQVDDKRYVLVNIYAPNKGFTGNCMLYFNRKI